MGIDSILSWIFFFFLIGSALVTALSGFLIGLCIATNRMFEYIERRNKKGIVSETEALERLGVNRTGKGDSFNE